MHRRPLHVPSLLTALLFAGLAVSPVVFGWRTVLLTAWGVALVAGMAHLLRLVLFERLLLPVRDGMREAERHDLRRRGRCTACGYDLRASPDACPECGTPRDQPAAPRTPAAAHAEASAHGVGE